MSMNVFCTLFDSNYLDKGIVLYQSLERVLSDFKLYVLAMDKRCYSVMERMNLPYLNLISLDDFETDDLRQIRERRSRQEYCWTCGCLTIRYVLDHYGESICTYIDADMMFYSNTAPLFDEFEKSGKSVGIMPHRFPNCTEGKRQERLSGKYCVEFNTFKNDRKGKKVLEWWCNKCIEECAGQGTGGAFGDQKYLDKWEELFDCIYVYQHLGAGVAPWNVSQYKIIKKEGAEKNSVWLKHKRVGQETLLVFYHFHQISYLNEKQADMGVNLRPGRTDGIWTTVYRDYLKRLDEIRQMLRKKYSIDLYANTRFEVLPGKLRYVGSYLKSDDAFRIKVFMIWRILIRRNRDIINF